MTFGLAICLVFVKFGMVQEIQAELMGFNGRLIYILGVPSLIGVLLTGGLGRVFSVRTAIYWMLFTAWFVIGVPFSTWKGGSVETLADYLKASLPMLFVIGGLVTTWSQCKRLATTIGIAGILNVISGRIFAGSFGGRYGLEFGTVANPNDYAAHLVLVLPFVTYLILTPRSVLVRIAAIVALGGGLYLTLKTASRGAEVALVADAMLFVIAGTAGRRLAVIAMAPIAAIALVIALPSDVLVRLTSFSTANSIVSLEAVESAEARSYVLRKSIEYTLQFPIFGIGMGQFPTYEGGHNTVVGTHGYWHGTHNSFTEAASEGGIPAGILLITVWLSTFFIVRKVNRQARARSDCADIEMLSFYALVSITGFIVTITFLNFAYLFYGPAMAGVAIAVKLCAEAEMAKRAAALGPAALVHA